MKIQQVMDCNVALVLKTSGQQANPLNIPYSSSTTPLVYAASYTSIFTHADPVNCPLTSCTLWDKTCNANTMPSNANNDNFY